MKIARWIGFIMLVGSLTGCNKIRHTLFPGDSQKAGVDSTSVCRATPTTYTFDVANAAPATQLTDNTDAFTGETNGADGIAETAQVCKRDSSGALTPCESVSGTGVLSDGTVFEFTDGHVVVKMAKSNGWMNYQVKVAATCHGA